MKADEFKAAYAIFQEFRTAERFNCEKRALIQAEQWDAAYELLLVNVALLQGIEYDGRVFLGR